MSGACQLEDQYVVNFVEADMGRPLVTPKFLANTFQTFGGVVLFTFLQPLQRMRCVVR